MRTNTRAAYNPLKTGALKTAALVSLIALAAASAFAAGPKTAQGGVITPEKAKALLAADSAVALLDVRTEGEFAAGHIEGAKLLPYDGITESSAGRAIPSKRTTVIVYCRTGRRSAIAAQTLRALGYETVWDLGGIVNWPYEIVK